MRNGPITLVVFTVFDHLERKQRNYARRLDSAIVLKLKSKIAGAEPVTAGFGPCHVNARNLIMIWLVLALTIAVGRQLEYC